MCRCSSSDGSIAAKKAHRDRAARLLALRRESRFRFASVFQLQPVFRAAPRVKNPFGFRMPPPRPPSAEKNLIHFAD